MGTAMEELLWHVDAKMEEEGWDLPPAIYAVFAEPLDATHVEYSLVAIPGWDAVRDATAGQIQEAIRLLTLAMKMVDIPRAPLEGIVLACEVWQVTGRAVFDTRSPSQHPERVEARMTYLASVKHPAMALSHERDGAPIMLTGDSLQGALPGLLHDLAAEMTQA